MSNMYERIEKLCKQNGSDVTKMCRELQIPRSSLSELKSGRAKSIAADKVAKIAEHFNVTALYITDGVEPDEKNKPLVQKDEELDENTIKIAGRNGKYIKKRLTDDQIDTLSKMVEALPDADDL